MPISSLCRHRHFPSRHHHRPSCHDDHHHPKCQPHPQTVEPIQRVISQSRTVDTVVFNISFLNVAYFLLVFFTS